jgi:hypothetical protein
MAMELRSSPNVYYERMLIDLLMLDLNKYTTTQNYAIVKNCNKISKQDIYIKY